jgi:hypothetical protein
MRRTRSTPSRGESLDAAMTVDNDGDDEDDDGAETASDGDADSPERPRHDVSHVHDFPVRSTRSGSTRDGRVRGGAMLVLDDEVHPPIAFSTGLPGGIQLSQLPDPRTVHEAMAAPDAEGWRDAMDS